MFSAGLCLLVLHGCTTRGLELGLSPAPDRSLTTGSISATSDVLSDDDVLVQAVSGADIKKGSLQYIPWLNPETGNSGVVSYVGQKRGVTEVCREFLTSKQQFDGIAQFHGSICRTRMGKTWSMKSLEKQG